MNRALVKRIADAVLYEGYILYPYRPSVKNRQRWTFGGLYPEAFCRSGAGDASANQAECLVEGGEDVTVEAAIRFLHLTRRRVGAYEPPLADWPGDGEPPLRFVESLPAGGRTHHAWQEAEEREIAPGGVTVGQLLRGPRRCEFAFPSGRVLEPLHGDGGVVGALVREQQALAGAVEMSAAPVGEGLYGLTVRVINETPFDGGGRVEAQLRSLMSAHTILGVQNGEFVSLTDPPGRCAEAAAACRNVGLWPVLVGEEGRRDQMLAAPIILYDYPQVAPESPGDFFDGAEIDEMLMLRVLTLTDEEKRDMAAVDQRARELLARTEGMGCEQMARLHGALRDVRPVEGRRA